MFKKGERGNHSESEAQKVYSSLIATSLLKWEIEKKRFLLSPSLSIPMRAKCSLLVVSVSFKTVSLKAQQGEVSFSTLPSRGSIRLEESTWLYVQFPWMGPVTSAAGNPNSFPFIENLPSHSRTLRKWTWEWSNNSSFKICDARGFEDSMVQEKMNPNPRK